MKIKSLIILLSILFFLAIATDGCKYFTEKQNFSKLLTIGEATYSSIVNNNQRTIILSPAIVEMFLFLDEKWSSQNIVGISDFTLSKSKLQKSINLGSIYNLSFEKLLKLKPKNIIIQGSNEKLTEFCKKYDIKIHKMKIVYNFQ